MYLFTFGFDDNLSFLFVFMDVQNSKNFYYSL